MNIEVKIVLKDDEREIIEWIGCTKNEIENMYYDYEVEKTRPKLHMYDDYWNE